MNLADHFFQDQHAFISFAELGAWCAKNGVKSPKDKQELLKVLLDQMGGKKVQIQWKGKFPEPAIMHISLTDHRLWRDRECWGKGVTIIDLGDNHAI
jgi:hypothetical protein